MSKYTYSTANLTDKELKEQGNRLFSLRKYEDAINCYTKAIVSVKKQNRFLVVPINLFSLSANFVDCKTFNFMALKSQNYYAHLCFVLMTLSSFCRFYNFFNYNYYYYY